MSVLAIDDLAGGLFGVIMAFLVLAGMIGLAWGVAWLIARPSKCSACGWRQGHHPCCSILDQLVDEAMRREVAIMARVHSGELTPFEAMRLVKKGEW